MEINSRVSGDRQLMDIGYKYNYRKFLIFIATEGYGITESGYPYLPIFHDNYSNVSVHPGFSPHVIGSYFNSFNEI